MRLFVNVRRLYRGLSLAFREPVLMQALALIAIATAFYWLVEEWSLPDAVSFSVVTIATVGYGDLAPQTAIGKMFTICYIFAGIGIIVAAVTAVAHAVMRAELPPEE